MNQFKYLWWTIREKYWDYKNLFKNLKTFYSTLKRMYVKDYNSYYQTTLVLLKQYHYHLLNGFIDIEGSNLQKSMQALRICISILERIEIDFYSNTYNHLIDNHDINDMFEKIENSDCYRLSENWSISSDMKLYESLKSKAEFCEKRDKKILHKLLEKYLETWWS